MQKEAAWNDNEVWNRLGNEHGTWKWPQTSSEVQKKEVKNISTPISLEQQRKAQKEPKGPTPTIVFNSFPDPLKAESINFIMDNVNIICGRH